MNTPPGSDRTKYAALALEALQRMREFQALGYRENAEQCRQHAAELSTCTSGRCVVSDLLASNLKVRADLLAGTADLAEVEEVLAKHHADVHERTVFESRYWSTLQQEARHDFKRLRRDARSWGWDCSE